MSMKGSMATPALAGGLLRVGRIYHEPAVRDYARGREILDRFSGAELVEVPSHWNIPELHGDEGGVGEWNTTKKPVLVLGVKKGLGIRSFYRSADFIAPSQANGCAMACSYCYVTRRKVSVPSRIHPRLPENSSSPSFLTTTRSPSSP